MLQTFLINLDCKEFVFLSVIQQYPKIAEVKEW